jgi:hypothetical protein
MFRKKDISTIKNGEESLRIFEGFFDFLSFKNIEDDLKKTFRLHHPKLRFDDSKIQKFNSKLSKSRTVF